MAEGDYKRLREKFGEHDAVRIQWVFADNTIGTDRLRYLETLYCRDLAAAKEILVKTLREGRLKRTLRIKPYTALAQPLVEQILQGDFSIKAKDDCAGNARLHIWEKPCPFPDETGDGFTGLSTVLVNIDTSMPKDPLHQWGLLYPDEGILEEVPFVGKKRK